MHNVCLSHQSNRRGINVSNKIQLCLDFRNDGSIGRQFGDVAARIIVARAHCLPLCKRGPALCYTPVLRKVLIVCHHRLARSVARKFTFSANGQKHRDGRK